MRFNPKHLLLLFVAIIGLSLTSCKDDKTDDPTPANQAPRIAALSLGDITGTQPGHTATSANVLAGANVVIRMDVSDDQGLASIEVRVKSNPNDVFPTGAVRSFSVDTTQRSFVARDTVRISASSVPGDRLFVQYIAIDKGGLRSAPVEYAMTVVAPQDTTTPIDTVGAAITSYTQTLLGSRGASDPSFYNVLTNARYSATQAPGNAASVDWAYDWDNTSNTNGAVIGSPASTYMNSNDAFAGGFNSWSVRNATKFVKVNMTQAQFNSINGDYKILQAWNGASGRLDEIRNLAIGDVVAFQTASSRGSKIGVYRVVALQTGNTGTITFDVKIQQ